jgi:hypothetical protein
MAARMGIRTTPADWREFVAKAADIVHNASPRSRVGAGGLFTEHAFFKEWASLSNLDVLTLDIYSLGALKQYNNLILLAKRSGKGVYIEETWRFPYQDRGSASGTLENMSSRTIGEQKYMGVDQKWLEAMELYAQTWGMEALTPFWTQTFFKYVPDNGNALDPSYNNAVAEAIRRGERTQTFRKYQALARKERGNK